MSDSPKTIPQLHAEVERLELEIKISQLQVELETCIRRAQAAKVSASYHAEQKIAKAP